jgi:hypothetical protein
LSRRWPSRQIRRVEKVIGRNVYRRLWSVVAQREESRRTGSLGETGAGIWMQNFDDTLSVCSKGGAGLRGRDHEVHRVLQIDTPINTGVTNIPPWRVLTFTNRTSPYSITGTAT